MIYILVYITIFGEKVICESYDNADIVNGVKCRKNNEVPDGKFIIVPSELIKC